MRRLAGRGALITGAGSGIGEATAKQFAAEGARVGVLDIEARRVEAVVAAITEQGGDALALRADVSDADQVELAVKQMLAGGRLDVLVNNAAVQHMGALHQCADAAVDAMINVNLKGSVYGCRAVLPTFIAQGHGTVLFTSSVLGLVADPDLAVYGATKAGMLALMRSIAVAYGPQGIRAVAVCPGDVETPLVAEYFQFQPNPSAARDAVYAHYPLRRIADPGEVAKVLVFLASEEASFISGTPIVVDGGLLANVY